MNFELWDGCDKWDREDGERILNCELGTSYKLAPAGGVKIELTQYEQNMKKLLMILTRASLKKLKQDSELSKK